MKCDIAVVSTTEKGFNPSSGTIGQCSLEDVVAGCHFTSCKIESVLIPHMPLTVPQQSGRVRKTGEWEKWFWAFKRGFCVFFQATRLLNQAEVLWVVGVWQENKFIMWPENPEWRTKIQVWSPCDLGNLQIVDWFSRGRGLPKDPLHRVYTPLQWITII